MKTGVSQLGKTLADALDWHTVVIKSTVVPGSTEETITSNLEIESGKTAGGGFGVAMNLEFLCEGTAVHDFLNPDKVVLGADDDRAPGDMRDMFAPLIEATDAPVVETNTRTTGMIKYANNSFLAAKINPINDIGNICKKLGIDAYEVADAFGLDDSIGEQFLQSGVGWEVLLSKNVAAIITVAKGARLRPGEAQRGGRGKRPTVQTAGRPPRRPA